MPPVRDSLFVFAPARPLIDSSRIEGFIENLMGVDILFSASGLGIGGFGQVNFTTLFAGFFNVAITGTRNTDEFPDYNGNVPNKVNRLFTIPLMFGVRHRLFASSLSNNFRPYINGGAGPTVLVALPYSYAFFPSIGHARSYLTGGGFIGLGAEVGNGRPVIGVNARYFVIPFSNGLESIRDSRITDFGGLFLTMNIGFVP